MTNREEEIAATCEIAAVESDVCVYDVLHIYRSGFNDGREGNMHSHQNKLYNHNIWYTSPLYKDLYFLYQQIIYTKVIFLK